MFFAKMAIFRIPCLWVPEFAVSMEKELLLRIVLPLPMVMTLVLSMVFDASIPTGSLTTTAVRKTIKHVLTGCYQTLFRPVLVIYVVMKRFNLAIVATALILSLPAVSQANDVLHNMSLLLMTMHRTTMWSARMA